MGYRVLIASRSFGSTSPKPWQVLENAGCDIVKVDMSRALTEDDLVKLFEEDIDGAIVSMAPVTEKVLKSAPSLKVITMHGVGVDHIDLEAASRMGIVVANCPGSNAQATADLAIGLMLSIARRIPYYHWDLMHGGWAKGKGTELWEKTIGLIGLGRIGQGVVHRALGFKMRVLVYDPYLAQDKENNFGVTFVSIEEVLKSADFLSLHAPLNDETKGMIGADELALMKSTAFLINTARGGLIDEDALYKALKSNQIAGAALDVFVDEPPVGSPLLQLENVVITPHIGAQSQESIERMGIMAAENILCVLRGERPHHQVS